MTDRELERLIQQVRGLDGFERDSDGVAEPRRVLARLGAAGLAAAACVALILASRFWQGPRSEPGPHGAAMVHRAAFAPSVSFCHEPGSGQPVVDVIKPSISENSTLLALLRSWNPDCQCLAWSLHEWRDGGVVTQASPGDSLTIEYAREPAPAESLLILAVAKDRAALPQGEAVDAFLECLNVRTYDVATADPAVSAEVVAACLPRGVKVVPHVLAEKP